MTSEGILVEIEEQPLQLERYVSFVSDPKAGAISTFSGVTRDNFEGKKVIKLEYEAYVPMALKMLRVIWRSKWIILESGLV